MRAAFLLLLAPFALAACDSGQVPSPADRQAGADAAEAVDPGRVALHGEGLVAGAEAFYFAAGRTEVEAALARILGKPGSSAEGQPCGAGRIDSATYADALTVNFQNDVLVGWTLTRALDAIAVDADATIGTAQDAVEDAPGFLRIEDSTLGDEFSLGENLGGIIENGEVSVLYAGTQCFSR